MRNLLLVALIVTVLAYTSAMPPKNCRGRQCRRLRPQRPLAQRPVPQRPIGKAPLAVVRKPVPLVPKAPVRSVPKAPVTKQPVVVVPPVTEKEKMVTDSDGNEVREVGVNGWLSSPTPAPFNETPAEARTEAPAKTDKPGSCDTPKGFGIKCMIRFDQCTNDDHCPGSTLCCMVGECGKLCVKPKPVSTEPKEVTKQAPIKKIKGDKHKGGDGDLTTEASELIASVQVPESGLKAEDVIEMPEKEGESSAEEVAEERQEVTTQGTSTTTASSTTASSTTASSTTASSTTTTASSTTTTAEDMERDIEAFKQTVVEDVEQVADEVEATTMAQMEEEEDEAEE